MSTHTTFKIRCRAIILHEGKLLVVKHRPESSHYALPGGHMEQGEDVIECVKREIVEELGVEPVIGRLAYVHTFVDKDTLQSVEFFFEVKNAGAFVDIEGLSRTHAHELFEIRWVAPTEDLKIRPEVVMKDFVVGSLLSGETKYTKG
jgi:ADP-ribose pyrophosphatase YjhB (NUDIX family)